MEVEDRECGALGEVGKFGSQALGWLQGEKFDLGKVWLNSACFTKPGAGDKEVTLNAIIKQSDTIFLCRSVFAIKTGATRMPKLPGELPESPKMLGKLLL